jgi:hypothetical protein
LQNKVSKASVNQNHGLEKRGHEWTLQNYKMATLVTIILQLLKLQSFFYIQTLGFENQNIFLNHSILPKL